MSMVSKSARLKIKRANSHIDTLIKHSTPLSRDLYEIGIERARTHVLLVNPDCIEITYRPKEELSQHFGGIIGDAINNMRESLDYWITAAFIAIGATGRQPNFPFEAECKDLESSGRYKSIKKNFPDLAGFILKDIKPCRSDNLDLWSITSLCNGNKHNDFLPVVSLTTIKDISIKAGDTFIKDMSITCNADSTLKLLRSNTPITIENNFSTSVEIKFPKGAIFEHKSVIPTLLHLSHVTTQTIDALDTFIVPYVR